MDSYILTIGKTGNGTPKEFVIKKGTSESKPEFIIADKKFTGILLSYSLEKKIYAPCRMRVCLQLDSVTTTDKLSENDYAKVTDAFMDKDVSLIGKDKTEKKYDDGRVEYTDTEFPLAQDYYIQAVSPSFLMVESNSDNSNSGQTIRVELEIYSKDYRLSLNRFCRAYTGKRFVSDIVKTENEDLLKASDVELSSNAYLQNICYTSKKDKDTKKLSEFRHPYLVQYDEPFYNFLARTANRWGELMFFEKGKLWLGLKYFPGQWNDITEIKKYSSITFNQINSRPLDVSNFFCPTAQKELGKGDSPYTTARYAQNSLVPADENIIELQKGKFASIEDEYFTCATQAAMHYIMLALEESTLADKIWNIAFSEALGWAKTAASTKGKNDKYQSANYKNIREDQGTEDVYTPFSTQPQTGDRPQTALTSEAVNLEALLYHEIYKAEKEAGEKAVTVNLDNKYKHLLLGDVVKVCGKFYVVTGITAKVESDHGTSENYTFTAVPVKCDKQGDIISVVPPLYEGGHICRSHSQRAFITETKDPRDMGRVRLRFPWQQTYNEWKAARGGAEKVKAPEPQNEKNYLLDTSSPWVRMASPITYNEAGFYFEPKEGTEVLVDFEGGNVEKPYVVGFLRNQNTLKPYTDKVIQSVNGHKIIFKDGKSALDFISGFSPALNSIGSFIPSAKSKMNNGLGEEGRQLSGGITLTDECGLYEISMSSSKRAINIESPLGNVSINAFTGIKVSAPNGDIKIEGKNVTISASNNLSITSGTHISDVPENGFIDLKSLGASLGEHLIDLGYKSLCPVDLSLLRHVIESFVAPCSGTLKIKSFRYLLLESGGGKAEIPFNAYNEGYGPGQKTAYRILVKSAHTLITETDNRLSAYEQLYNEVKTAKTNLCNELQRANKTGHPAPANGAVKTAVEGAITAGNCNIDFNGLLGLDRSVAEDQAVINNLTSLVNNFLQASVRAYNDKIAETVKIKIGTENYEKALPKNAETDALYSTDANFSDGGFVLNAANKAVFLRKTVRDMINSTNNHNGLKLNAIPALNAADNADWEAFANGLTESPVVPPADLNFGTALTGALGDSLKKIPSRMLGMGGDESIKDIFQPTHVWTTEGSGDLLLSGRKGQTLKVADGGALNVVSSGNLETFKEVLKRMIP